MKNILITLTMLIMVLLPWTTNAQDIEILNITLNELPTHSGLADNGIFYTASLPNNVGCTVCNGFTDAKITRYNANGIPMDDVFFTNENPSFATVNQVYFYANPQNDDFIATALTWGTGGGTLLWSESLFFLDDDLIIDDTVPQLVAFGSTFHGRIMIGDTVYVLWYQGNSFSKLIYDDVDDSENSPSLVADTYPTNSLWLLEIGNDPSNKGTLLNSYPIGNTSENMSVFSSFIDGFLYREDFNLLDNGYFSFEAKEGVGSTSNPPQLYIIDPANPGTPVHVFTDLPGGAEDIIICDNKYYISTRMEKRIFVYDDAFNLIDENFELDFAAGKPGKLSCLSNNDIMAFAYMDPAGQASDPMTRHWFTPRAFAMGFERILDAPDWEVYTKSYMLTDTKSLHITAYQGPQTTFAGSTIPATSGQNNYHTVIWTADFDLSPPTMTFNEDLPGVITVHMNARYDPNDPTQLIDCSPCREAVISIEQDEFDALPEDLDFSQFLIDLINTGGERLWNANMGTDYSIADTDLNRFMVARMAENVTGSIASAAYGETWKVFLTSNIFQSLGTTDTFNIENVLKIYPNPTQSTISINSSLPIEKIHVYTMAGQIVGRFGNVSNIDLSNYDAGIYLFRIHADNGSMITKKIIKQ